MNDNNPNPGNNSDNNNFDNFNNYGGTQSAAKLGESQVAAYMTKVMGWMAAGLAITFGLAWLVYSVEDIAVAIISNEIIFYGILIAEIAVVFIMSALIEKMSSTVALLMFMLYASLSGLTVSIFMVAYADSIGYVLGLTSVIFIFMAVYGFVTKKDMTKIGSMCLFGLFGIIVAGIFNMFMRSDGLDYIISIVGVLIFIGLTAWDTQIIKNKYLYATSQGENPKSDYIQKHAIIGALMLYLDFINLFLRLLRLFGRRSR